MTKRSARHEEQLPMVLQGKSQLGPYPMEKLKRVDAPTTKIVGMIERFDERNTGFNKAFRGEYGEHIGVKGFLPLDMSIMSYFFKRGGGKPGFGKNQFDLKMDPEKLAKMKAMSRSGGAPSLNAFSRDLQDEGGEPVVQNIGSEQIAEVAALSLAGGSFAKPISPDAQIGNGSPQELHPDSSVVSRHIKRFGYFLGADVMGICRIPDYAYYSHDRHGNPIEKTYEYAILIVVDQDYGTMKGSDGRDWISSAQSIQAYSNSAFIAAALARYIQFLGHDAKDNHMHDYQVVLTPLLLLAGIGELARNGIVLNPFIGTRYKAAVVLTNMRLEVDKPVDFGLQDFCKKCKKCAAHCPPKAISLDDELIIHNGYERYDFDADGCTKFRLSNPHGSSCGTCIKVCPFNKPRGVIHDFVRWMIRSMPIMNSLIVKADDLLKYEEAKREYQWWFDPETGHQKRNRR